MTTEEIEYIEPTQEHVGQIVEVKQGNHWEKRKLLAVLPVSQTTRFICQHNSFERDYTAWNKARIARPLTYAERQAKCGLKVGDRVKFVRRWEYSELDTTIEFIEGGVGMSGWVGKTGAISLIKDDCIRVQFVGQYWYLPYFVLEKVETQYREIQCDIGAKVVRINPNNKPTEYTLHNIFIDSDDCKYGVVKDRIGHWDVIELCDLRIEVQ